jgi:hypothetical protein
LLVAFLNWSPLFRNGWTSLYSCREMWSNKIKLKKETHFYISKYTK